MRSFAIRRQFGLAVGACLAVASLANAHFVWILSEATSGGKLAVRAGFGEPGDFDVKLAGRIKQAEYFTVSKTGATAPLALSLVESKGLYEAALNGTDVAAVCGVCDYGVVAKGNAEPFRLTYIAKRMVAPSTKWSTVAPNKRLMVEIMPTLKDGVVDLAVIAGDKPLANADVNVHGPKTESTVVKTDANGHCTFKLDGSGEYGIYVGHTVKVAGEKDGKTFASSKEYATLTFAIPAEDKPAVASTRTTGSDDAAAALFVAARSNRNVWDEKFQGFSANLKIEKDALTFDGKVSIGSGGDVTLELPNVDEAVVKSVRRVIESMASHRLVASGKPKGNPAIKFGEAPSTKHVAGTLLETLDDSFKSSHRIKDNRVTVVNRQMGPNKMTITMLENLGSSDGRYLPGTYNVATWDKDGNLVSSTTTKDEWTTLKGYTLPVSTMWVTTGKGKWEVTRLEYSNHKLAAEPPSGNE